MEETALTTSDLETLIKMVFLDGETFSMLLEDGHISGQIGEAHLFRASTIKGFTSVYRVDIMTMDEKIAESYIFHKHSSNVPKDRPGASMELYMIESDALDQYDVVVSTPRGKPRAYRNPREPKPKVDFKRDNPLKLVLRM